MTLQSSGKRKMSREWAVRDTENQLFRSILREATSITDVPVLIEQMISDLRTKLMQTDWETYEDRFGTESKLFRYIQSEAKSVPDVSAFIGQIISDLQTELTQKDWELDEDQFGVKPVKEPYDLTNWHEQVDSEEQRLHDAFQTLVEGIRQSSEVVLYEGLPSRHDKLYYHERSTHKTFVTQQYRFYAEPLDLQKADATRLTALCCDPQYLMLNGTHLACMFHADYCLEWRDGQAITQILFCFSCDEVMGCRDSTQLLVPMNRSPFKSILMAYQKNRPPETIRV